jgi:hypothetical protein
VVAVGIWLTVGGAVTAQSPAQQGDQTGAVAAFGPQPQTLFQLVGGPLKRVWTDVVDTPTTIFETVGFNFLPGADVTAAVRALTTDMFVVTFSGECRLFNAGPDDWAQLEVVRTQTTILGITTTVPLEPQSPTGADSMAFCGSNSWNMNSAQFAVRLGGGTLGMSYRFRVRWRIVDTNNNDALSAWLDDYTLKVEQYE